MNQDRGHTSDPQTETVEVPRWLDEALRMWREAALFEFPGEAPEEVSEAFGERSRSAAGAALHLARLRAERARVGFVALSLNDYLRGLAKVTKVDLAPLLRGLGIADLSRLSAAAGPAWARLCETLGFSLREALAHLRIGFAEQTASAPVLMLAARHRGARGRRSPLEECEDILSRLPRDYIPEEAQDLRALEEAFLATYRERGESSAEGRP